MIELYPYQVEAVNFILARKRVIIGEEPGLGKSAEAISAIKQINAEYLRTKKLPKALKVLVVCPNTLKENWAREFIKFYPESKGYLKIISGSSLEKIKLLALHYTSLNSNGIYILDYSALSNNAVFDMLMKFSFDFIVFDEAHRLKNYKSIRGRNAIKLAKKSRINYLALLTGTPLINKVSELWPLLSMIDPQAFNSRKAFIERFVGSPIAAKLGVNTSRFNNYNTENITSYNKEKILDLKNILKYYMIRRLKKDVLKDLPEVIYSPLYIELDDEQRQLYNTIETELCAALSETTQIITPIVITKIMRLKQICISPNLLHNEPGLNFTSSKLEALYELIEDRYEDEKIVIFSQFKSAIKIIAKHLTNNNIKFVEFTGDNVKTRDSNVQQFQEVNEVRIFLATSQSGGEGITLTAASLCILLDRPWTAAAVDQNISRLDRIGQLADRVEVVSLIATDTIEETIELLLDSKQAMVASLMATEIYKLNEKRKAA